MIVGHFSIQLFNILNVFNVFFIADSHYAQSNQVPAKGLVLGIDLFIRRLVLVWHYTNMWVPRLPVPGAVALTGSQRPSGSNFSGMGVAKESNTHTHT